jgi:UPF0176 protein
MIKETEYRLITFYKFVDIANPIDVVKDHKQFCSDIGMKGRIYIGEEGINAQISCNTGQEKAYRLFLDASEHFKNIQDIDTKATPIECHKFPKMIVKYRNEIVAMGEIYKSSEIAKSTFKMSIDEFKEVMDSNPDDYVILDMRNDYEYELGHFKTAIPAATDTFKEVMDKLKDYKAEFAEKEVIMYCTGGIRCEKLGALLENSGLKGVRQLDGGVIKYVNTFDDGNWLGNLYTFDDRISTYVGSENTHTVISKSYYSDLPAEDYFNCRYADCQSHFTAKPDEYKKHYGFCSEQCRDKAIEDLLIRNADFDKNNYKLLRGSIKQNPALEEMIKEKIRKEILAATKNIEFKFKVPVKRRFKKGD